MQKEERSISERLREVSARKGWDENAAAIAGKTCGIETLYIRINRVEVELLQGGEARDDLG